MAWHPNSKQHKINHCGYRVKPTKGQISALLGLYSDNTPTKIKIEKKINNQLNLFG